MKNHKLTLLFLAVAAAVVGVDLPTYGQAPSTATVGPTNCAHGIDSTKCPFCDPSRIERLGVCREHAVPEALCVKCRPFLETAFVAAGDWCKEHSTPESQCAICNPAEAKAGEARAQSAGAELRWQREPSMSCVTSSTPVTLSSPSVVRTIGLEFAQVKEQPLVRTIDRPLELAYNGNRYARLSSRAGGVIAEMNKDLGEVVKKGDVLAVVDSSDLGAAKSDLLQALEMSKLWEANAAREKGLLEKGVGIERETLEAATRATEARIAADRARQRLRTLGLTSGQVEAVEQQRDTSPLLELVAPFDGTIVERDAVLGEVVEVGKPLVAIADTGLMWALVHLTESDLGLVRVGQTASVSLDGLPGKPFSGKVAWISTQVDPKTRTVRARIELDNGQGLLRANMFGRARISGGENRQAITVPKQAVQWEGCCNVAFVRTDAAGTAFRPARLVLAYDTGDSYEVASGLSPGDTIVTGGSYILKNEILKNSVGAGCCEIDHLKK